MPNVELEIAGDPLSLPANDRAVAVRHRTVPAWLMSFALHTTMLVSLAAFYRSTIRGANVESTRAGGIVLVAADTETTEYLSEGENSDTSAPSETVAQSPPPLPDQTERPVELPGVAASTAEVSGIGDDLLEALPGVNTPTDGTHKGRDIGGKVTTDVFGVKGTGSRFIYVFDRSDSMDGYESRPPSGGYEYTVELGMYQVEGWKHPQRLILVVVDPPHQLMPPKIELKAGW